MTHRLLLLGLWMTVGCAGATAGPPSPTKPATAAEPKSSASAPTSASAAPAKTAPEPRYAGSKFDLDPAEPLPRGAIARCGTTRMRMPARSAVAVTNDGKVFAIATGTSSRELRELTAGTTTTLDASPYEAVFSPDATRLVVRPAYSGGKVSVLDVASGKVVGELTIDLAKGKPSKNAFVVSGTEYIDSIRYSPDGSVFFVLTSKSKLVTADGRTGKVLRTRQVPYGTLLDVSADGSRALVLTRDPPRNSGDRFALLSMASTYDTTGYVVLDLVSGATIRKEQFKLEKREDPGAAKVREHWTAAFALALDGRTVYRREHGDLDAIDVASGKTRSVVKRDKSDFFSGFGGFNSRTIDLHPDGKHAIIDAQLVDLETGQKGRRFEHSFAAISKNLRRVVTREGDVLHVDGVETREGHNGAVTSLGFLPEGRVVVAADGHLHFWDAGSCDRIAKPEVSARAFRMAQAAPLLAIDGYPTLFVDGTGKLTKMKQSLRHESLALAPDGSRVYGGIDNYEEESEIVALDLEGKPQKSSSAPSNVRNLAISPGGTRLAVSSGYGEDSKFEIRRTSDLGVETSSGDNWDRVFFAREDRLIAHGYSGVTILDVPSLKTVEKFGAGACCQVLAVSKDGKRVAGSWDRTIYVWELDPPKLVTTLRGHSDKVSSLAFSPDGTTLASGSEDTTVLLWDVGAPPAPVVERAATPVGSGPPSLDRWSTGYHSGAAFVRDDGTLGVAGRIATPAPAGLRDIKRITAGASATCVLGGTGVSCWGSTGGGVLGVPEEKGATKYRWKERTTPVLVPGVTNPVDVEMWTAYACAKEKTGALVCWGRLGEPGNDAPRRVLEGVTEFGLGWNQACALRNDGDVMCWSAGGATPTAVKDAPKAVHLAVGSHHVCVLGKDKRVYCWGQGTSDQMGDGLGRDSSKPTAIEGVSDVVAITAHGSATCVRTEKDDVFCWGGFGSGDRSLVVPTLIKGLRGTKGIEIFADERVCAESKGGLACVDLAGR